MTVKIPLPLNLFLSFSVMPARRLRSSLSIAFLLHSMRNSQSSQRRLKTGSGGLLPERQRFIWSISLRTEPSKGGILTLRGV